jgi:hypothetical protein
MDDSTMSGANSANRRIRLLYSGQLRTPAPQVFAVGRWAALQGSRFSSRSKREHGERHHVAYPADHVAPAFLRALPDGNLVASSTAANTATSTAWSIFRFGWGFSTNQDFDGDIALIACFASSWTAAMVRRWHADPFGFLRPWNEVPALMGSVPPTTPPSTGTGVVTFLMG